MFSNRSALAGRKKIETRFELSSKEGGIGIIKAKIVEIKKSNDKEISQLMSASFEVVPTLLDPFKDQPEIFRI